MAKLTGPQIGQLQELILDAFSQREFEELLLVRLDIRLDQVISADLDWRAAARETILVAGREGWTADLLSAIAEGRPRRKDIQGLIAELLPLVESVAPQATQTPSPAAARTRAPAATSVVAELLVTEPDGAKWVHVPAGEFLMGSTESDADAYEDERPQHTVYLGAFQIMQTEVTNAMFERFVNATGHRTMAEAAGKSWVFDVNKKKWKEIAGANWRHPRGPGSNLGGLGSHPVVHVSWDDAVAYCAWAGGRLPTEAEWEKAARGTDGRKYPWGNQPPAGDLLNFADRNLDVEWADKNTEDGYQFTAPVGSYPKGASPYGALDMAGNVWEWVADWYDAAYYAGSPRSNPTGPADGEYRVLRGGCWNNDAGTSVRRPATGSSRTPGSTTSDSVASALPDSGFWFLSFWISGMGESRGGKAPSGLRDFVGRF
jgi:formylglycine-generating enzyme required for sulfatase activity